MRYRLSIASLNRGVSSPWIAAGFSHKSWCREAIVDYLILVSTTVLCSGLYFPLQLIKAALHLIEILRNLDHIRHRYLSLVNETREGILTFNLDGGGSTGLDGSGDELKGASSSVAGRAPAIILQRRRALYALVQTSEPARPRLAL